ncbi:toll-like receptor Tollo [Argonauta hians]
MPKFPASLVSLDLRKNNIKKISSVLNDTNNHLKYLILADNAIETIENDAFSQLQYLRLLNLKNNNISDINDFHFKSLYMLYGLNIAFNNIKYLSPNTISHLQQLQILYCQHNQLTMLNREMFPKGLAHIDLSHNHITTLSNNLIYDMDNLIELNLRSNNLSHLSSSSFRRSINGKPARILLGGNKLKCDCHLSWLKKVILHNQKYAFHGNIFSDFMFCYQDNPRLPARSMDTMNIDDFLCEYNSRNHIKYYCPYDCHCCSKNLQTCPCFNICPNNCLCLLSLDKNIHKIDCRNSNLTHLERIPPGSFIDLSGNNLNYFDSTNFTNHNTTESLYMNNSQILIIANNTFYTFTKLKRLYLQNNLIEALEEDSFAGLENLQELFLYNNKIQYIPSNTFSKTPKLQYLDLHKNKLKRITSELFSNKALKKINLNHNPWSCKCDDVILFEDIVIKDNELLVDGDNISCDYNISLSISVLDYAKTFCQNTTYNFTTKAILHKDKVLISTISSLSVILLIVFIFTIISYIYRKEIQLYLFVHFGYRLMTEKLKIDEENKLYDAFISFDNSMDKFVIDELLPQLEQNDPPFKLCVHFRDFEVGLQITENIITCIENSKRTVLLLTDNFLKSDWCKYEFQTAHYQGLSKKMKTLIVVFFEDINEDLLDPDLKLYLKTNTYLKYDDPWFWDKLRFALPQKNNSNTTKC